VGDEDVDGRVEPGHDERRFKPNMSQAMRERKLKGWARAVKGLLASDEGEEEIALRPLKGLYLRNQFLSNTIDIFPVRFFRKIVCLFSPEKIGYSFGIGPTRMRNADESSVVRNAVIPN